LTGEVSAAEAVAGGEEREFTAPFPGDAVLHLSGPRSRNG